MNSRRISITTTLGLAVLIALSGDPAARAQGREGAPAPVTPAEMLKFFNYSPEDVKKLEQGEILSVDLPKLEGSGKGLAVGFAMVIPHGVGDCSQQFAGPEMFRVDPNVLAFARVDPQDLEGSLRTVEFSAEEVNEARAFLQAKPGSELNLSLAEIQKIKARKAEVSTTGASEVGTASAALRELLEARFSSYLERGLQGIEAYARSARKSSSAAEDLEVALANSPIIENRLPAFHRHLRHYPGDPAEGVKERFYWVKRKVEGRPIFSLVHWSLLVHPQFAFLSEREVYVSHSYNAQQVYFGVLPYKEGVMVFYLNRTFTDQADIFAKSIAHRIGRSRMEAPIRETFENMRAQIVP